MLFGIFFSEDETKHAKLQIITSRGFPSFFFFFFRVNKKIVLGVKGKIASESQEIHTTGACATGNPLEAGKINLDLFSKT